MTRPHLPHAIVVKLLARKVDDGILLPEIAGLVGVGSSSPPRVVGFVIQGEHVEIARSADVILHCTRLISARFPINIIYTPVDTIPNA